MRGTIQKIYPDKNYGFLRGDEETMDRFFHGGSIAEDSPVPFVELKEQDVVSFEPNYECERPRVAEKSIRLLAKDNGDVHPPPEPEEEL